MLSFLPTIEEEADTLYVAATTCDQPCPGKTANLYEMAGRTLEIFLQSLRNDLSQLSKIKELVKEGKEKAHRIIRAIPLYPCHDLGEVADFLIFSRERTRRLIDLGYRDAKEMLPSSG